MTLLVVQLESTTTQTTAQTAMQTIMQTTTHLKLIGKQTRTRFIVKLSILLMIFLP
jgi:hypothetical protein